MELVTDTEISMRATFVRLGLKMKAVRAVPEGLCMRCEGTGNGEEIADLGEARFHTAEFPIKQCKSCSGSGMATAHLKITAVGLLLLGILPVAIWVFPWQVQLVLASSVVVIAALEAIRGRDSNTRRKIETQDLEQTIEIAPIPDVTGPGTDQLLSLGHALQKHRRKDHSDKFEPTVAQQTDSSSVSKSV